MGTNPEDGIEPKYTVAADLLEAIWLGIDWESHDKNRLRGIWGEFENQARALSKCYSRLEPFIDKMCARFRSNVFDSRIRDILASDHEQILDIYRMETQIPVLLLRLRRKEIKDKRQEAREPLDVQA